MRAPATTLALVSLLAAPLLAAVACNNAAALCSRAYNDVAHLGAHDSPFVRDAANGFTIAGDQFYNSVTQLEAGVRMLTAQVHRFTTLTGQTQWHLCHTLCALYDAGPLVNWLHNIKGWMDKNPNEVVTILLVNSDNANATTLGRIFQNSGISHYAYKPPVTTQPSKTWPTLGTLISTNKRLLIFIGSLDPTTNTAAPYLLDEFTFIFSNQYDVTSPSGFNCTANQPASVSGNTPLALSMGLLPAMNHFMYDNINGIEIPAVEHVDNTNAPSGSTGNLGTSAQQCTAAYGKPPTYIIVDFFNVGPALATVDKLNGVVGNTTGRKALPTTVLGSMGLVLSSNSKNEMTSGQTSSGGATPTSAATSMAASSSTKAAPPASSGAAVGLRGGYGIASALVAVQVLLGLPWLV